MSLGIGKWGISEVFWGHLWGFRDSLRWRWEFLAEFAVFYN